MRKLIYVGVLLGGMLLPMVPPAQAQRTVVVTPHPVRRGLYFYRGHWYNHRFFHRGRWWYR